MKYRPSHYAEAFRAAIEAGMAYDTAHDNLVRTLEKHGDRHRLPQVVAEIEAREVAKQGGHMVAIELAREVSASAQTALKNAFSDADRIETRINPDLVAGVRVTIDHERELDLSLRGKMRTLFH
jgi:F0F1-type ATP synthase delta subunit